MLYMLDTNIISYFAEGNQNVISNLEKCMLAGNSIGISVVAYYEVERGLKYINAVRKLNDFHQFVSQCKILPITVAEMQFASQIYANLRRDGKLIEDADIFIGASALINNAILVTNNEEHFSRIAGLKIENWTK
ncbi:MAG: type II toxin-antitoxin system VapC family toxin [Spirochaetaceae bacterium]|nr:type II toxin-antitoxin system VapC family toxin [Spirochaetaceae bacterium]